MAQVVSVNVGMPRKVAYETSSLPETGIEKRPVEGPVRITEAGVEGNAVADTRNHGDEYMRVYAYSVEDYAWWQAELSRPLAPGQYGEQLTTAGLDLNEALLGETWRVGTALLQVSHVRIPCLTFKGWMDHSGYDAASWVKRFVLAGRPGPYLRVLEEGEVAAGDPLEVVDRPDHGVTVAHLFRAVTIQPGLLPPLLDVPGLKPWIYERAATVGRGPRPG
ncbi:MOSC domain-containing protein [Nocardioides marmoriginsengisoli]|uniref:MOSC domain-containing protein n=1 Tax=Nocardioides marmoriginsengisoli TaxID=661483 RepID=A0A3N0CK62_9ACTN|nr:MOSC domain-containing protein [Nocardioides marmoriginsengisoli]RNL63729.1 MOSC domain-containing protein [Nocardioides marmoriginsengisoli]